MQLIDQIGFKTEQANDGREYDVVRLWIGGVPFSAHLQPQVERIARRIAQETGLEIIDARKPKPRFDFENACPQCGPTCEC